MDQNLTNKAFTQFYKTFQKTIPTTMTNCLKEVSVPRLSIKQQNTC